MRFIFNTQSDNSGEEQSNSQAMLEFAKVRSLHSLWQIYVLTAPFRLTTTLLKRCVKFTMGRIIMLETHVNRRSALAHRLRNILLYYLLYTLLNDAAREEPLERNGLLYKQWLSVLATSA